VFPHLVVAAIRLSQSPAASEPGDYGDVTVSVVGAVREHEVAVMVVVPGPSRVAKPFVPVVLLI